MAFLKGLHFGRYRKCGTAQWLILRELNRDYKSICILWRSLAFLRSGMSIIKQEAGRLDWMPLRGQSIEKNLSESEGCKNSSSKLQLSYVSQKWIFCPVALMQDSCKASCSSVCAPCHAGCWRQTHHSTCSRKSQLWSRSTQHFVSTSSGICHLLTWQREMLCSDPVLISDEKLLNNTSANSPHEDEQKHARGKFSWANSVWKKKWDQIFLI